MNSWKKTSFLILVSTLFLLGILLFLISTTSGLSLLLHAANRWTPGLKIEQVSNNWHKLYLRNISYIQPGMNIIAGEFLIDMKFSYFHNGSIFINRLSLIDANITIDTEKISSLNQVTWRNKINNIIISYFIKFLKLYPVYISHIKFNNFNIKINNNNISIMELTSGLHGKNRHFTFKPTYLQELSLTLPKVKTLLKKWQEIVIFKIDKQYSEKFSFSTVLKEIFSKPILPAILNINLPLNFNIEELKIKQLKLISNTNLTIYQILLKVSIINGNIYINTLDIYSNQGMFRATGIVQLHDSWQINIVFEGIFKINPFCEERLKLQISGAISEILKINMHFSGPVEMFLCIQTQLLEVGLPLDINITSKQFVWQNNNEKYYQANNSTLKLNGKATDYALSFCTSVKGNNIPLTSITLDAKGNAQQINLNKLTVTTLNNKVELTALLNWQQSISWYGEMKFKNINTEKVMQKLPSKLNGFIITSGSLNRNSWRLKIPKIKITGTFKQNKVKINGMVKSNHDSQLIIPNLYVSLGYNSLSIKGTLGTKCLDIRTVIDAPNIGKILPGINGKIKGLLKLNGSMKSPQISMNINANNIFWHKLSIVSININSNIKFTNQIYGKLNVHIKQLTQFGMNVKLAILSIKGSEKQHNMQLMVQGKPISGQLNLVGSFDRYKKNWYAKLTNSTIFNTPIGPWVPFKKIKLHYDNIKNDTNIYPYRNHPDAKLYVTEIVNVNTENHAILSLNYFDIANLEIFKPGHTTISGAFIGQVNLNWDINQKELPYGSILLSGRNIKLTHTNINNDTALPIIFKLFDFKMDLYHNDNMKINWLIKLPNDGQCDGKIQVTGMQVYRNINGNLNVHNFDLSLVNLVCLYEENVSGILNANLKFTGNFLNPQVFGWIQFNNVDIDNNYVSLDVESSQLTINFNGTYLRLHGRMFTQNGLINLNGYADWNHINNWYIRLGAKGHRIHINMSSMIDFNVSLDVLLEVEPNLVTIDGFIDLPLANIKVQELPESAVDISDDEYIFNRNSEPIKSKNNVSISINSNLIIHVGNNVKIDAFGLKAKLDGNLKIIQDKQGLGFNGQINIDEGKFNIYGQDLLVSKGELLFVGAPKQPILNIEAIRNPETTENNLIVGVRITGSINELKIEAFSDPPISQQEMLSYLLNGHGLNNNQLSNNTATMTSVILGFGVAQGGHVISKIGEKLGIKHLSLETNGIGDSSQIVASGHVLPRLNIRYGVGIFDSLATLKLRYCLMPKLYLEVISGIDYALDLLYKFNF